MIQPFKQPLKLTAIRYRVFPVSTFGVNMYKYGYLFHLCFQTASSLWCGCCLPYVKELEGRRGGGDTLRLAFHGAEDAEECARVVNLEGKTGSRTLTFHDVCRTLDETKLRDFFVRCGAVVERLELFRTEEEDGFFFGRSKGCGVVLLSDPADAERLEGELDLPQRRGSTSKAFTNASRDAPARLLNPHFESTRDSPMTELQRTSIRHRCFAR